MSAVIEELKIRNFEGYRAAEVVFTEGLNLIKGRNSAGKSTLLDALLFALYGKIPGVHPKLLVSRLPGKGEMVAFVKFKNPASGAIIEVYRSGSLDMRGNFQTSKLTLKENGKEQSVENDEDLKKKVTERMGISLRKFTNLAYVRQGSLQEILEPRREDMDLILRLTVTRELKEQIDEARKAFEKHEGKDAQTELQNIKTIILPQLQSSIRDLERDIRDLGKEMGELEKTIGKAESPALLELLNSVKAKERLEEQLVAELNKAQTLLSQAGAESREELLKLIEDNERRQRELRQHHDKLEEEAEQLWREWNSHSGKASTLYEEIQQHGKLLKEGVATCPTCGQDLKAETLEGILESKRRIWTSLSESADKLKKAYEDKKADLKRIGDDLNEVSNRIERLKNLDRDLHNSLGRKGKLRGEIGVAETLIERHLKTLGLPFEPKDPELRIKVAQTLPLEPERLESMKREYRDKKERLTAKTGEADRKNSDLQKYQLKASELEEQLKAAELAGKLSERLEAAIETRRGDVLKRIEARALAYYKRMTDQHDYDSIRIDPETYAVSVHPINMTEHIPAKRDGGGHQTILALALRLALLDETGFRSLLILDEPTYGVDSENLPQLAEYLGEVSRLLAQTILVTHHNICEEEASNIIEVEKRVDGTSWVQTKF